MYTCHDAAQRWGTETTQERFRACRTTSETEPLATRSHRAWGCDEAAQTALPASREETKETLRQTFTPRYIARSHRSGTSYQSFACMTTGTESHDAGSRTHAHRGRRVADATTTPERRARAVPRAGGRQVRTSSASTNTPRCATRSRVAQHNSPRQCVRSCLHCTLIGLCRIVWSTPNPISLI